MHWCDDDDSPGLGDWSAACVPVTRCAEPCACCDAVEYCKKLETRPPFQKGVCCKCLKGAYNQRRPTRPGANQYRRVEFHVTNRERDTLARQQERQAYDADKIARRCIFESPDGTRCTNYGSHQTDAGLLCNQHKPRWDG